MVSHTQLSALIICKNPELPLTSTPFVNQRMFFSLLINVAPLTLTRLFTLLIITAHLTLLFFSLSLSSSMNQVVLSVISTTVQMKQKHKAFGASTQIRDWFFGDLGNWGFVEAVIGFCDCYFWILEVTAMVISAMIM